MSEIVRKDPTTNIIDNFEGWDDGIEGDDRPQGAGIIQGILVKFTNEAKWITRDGGQLPTDLELVAVDVARIVQKWEDQRPVKTIILEPHQKFPDIVEKNNKAPREEWAEGPNGQMRGPWQGEHVLYLLDPKTMDKYSFPTHTTGGRIAVRDLRDKTMWMRRLRGPNVYAVITLADMFMNTKFGGRQRPSFKIVRWVRLGGEGGEVEALPPPTPRPTQQPAQQDLPPVAEPSLAEEMDDEIPDFGAAAAPPWQSTPPPKTAPSKPNVRRDLKKSSQKPAKPADKKQNILDAG